MCWLRLCTILMLLWLLGGGLVKPTYATAPEAQNPCLQHEPDWSATERDVWASVCQTGEYRSDNPCGARSFRGEFTPPVDSERAAMSDLFLLDSRFVSPQTLARLTIPGDAYLPCLRQEMVGAQKIPAGLAQDSHALPDFVGATIANRSMSLYSGWRYFTPFRFECRDSRARTVTGTFLRTLLTKSPYRERIISNGSGVRLEALRITDRLDLSGVTIPYRISLRCFALDYVNLFGTTIEGDLRFDTGEIKGIFDELHVKGDFSMHTVASLAIYGSRITVDKVLEMRDVRADYIQLRGSTLGDLTISQSDVVGIYGDGMKVNGSLELDDVTVTDLLDMSQIHTLGDMRVSGSNLKGKASVRLASLEGSLLIDEASIFEEVDASDSRIGGQLGLSEIHVKNRYDRREMTKPPTKPEGWNCSDTQWTGVSSLDLSGAHVNVIHVSPSMKVWPKNLNLSGLEFQYFHVDDRLGTPTEGFSPGQWFKCWLARTPPRRYDQRYEQRYDPWPYREVADFLQRTGAVDASREVAVAGRNRERAEACHGVLVGPLSNKFESGLSCIVLWLSLVLVGYGYYLALSIGWAAGFIGIGWYVFSRMEEAKNRTPEEKEKMRIGLAYSFDMFLPLVRLRDKHYNLDINSRARYYLYVHKLAGWVLGSFIVAALGGLTQ